MSCWSEKIPLGSITTARVLGTGFPPTIEQAVQNRERAAFEAGRETGERQLSEQLVRQRTELLQLQSGVFNKLQKLTPQLIQDCESMLVDLALEVASKLVASLPISREVMETTVREALSQVEETCEMTVLLHEEDLKLLQELNSPLLLTQVGGQQLKFQNSREVTRGGCIVHTRFGVVDARRETKLERLRKALEE